MSKKQEVFELIQQKQTLSTEELNIMYEDLAKEYEKRGVKPTEDMVLNRLFAYLTPALNSSATKHTAILLGVEDNFGFNQIVAKVKFDSIKQYQENKIEAINNRVVDEQGNPLWHYVDGLKIADFKIGKPITPYDFSATAYCFVEDGKKNLSLKTVQLRAERRENILKNLNLFINKKVEFMGTDKETTINDSKYFNIKVIDETLQDISTLLSKYAKDNCVNLKSVETFYKKNIEHIKTIPVFVRGTIKEIMISETKDNNIISFSDTGYNKDFSIYVPKNLEIPSIGSTNIIFGGRLRYDENSAIRPYTLNAFMVYSPQENIDFVIPESVRKRINVEVDGDIIKSQRLLEIKKEVEQEW